MVLVYRNCVYRPENCASKGAKIRRLVETDVYKRR